MKSLATASVSSCSLWLNNAMLGGIPSVYSRHNTPSRAHALSRLVEMGKMNGEKVAIIVSQCMEEEMRV